MSYNTTISSIETKNFYSNGRDDTGYVVGSDWLDGVLLGRIMRYEIIIPAEVKKINNIKINFQGNGWGFGYGPSGSFDALKDNVYCCFRSVHNLNNLSPDIKVVMLNGNNGSEHWPYTETISSIASGTNINNILKGGQSYYLYVYSRAWNSFGNKHYWRYFGSTSARAQIVLEYEIYSQVTSPTLNSPPIVVVPGGKYGLSWSGASNGTANNITSYKITLGNNSWSFAANELGGDIIIPSGQKRGQTFNWTIQAIGQVSGYDGKVNVSGGCLINTPPNPPVVNVDRDIVSYNGGTVNFTVSAGSDSDRHTTSVLYKRKGDDEFIPWDYQGQEVKSTTTFEFVTSDQYEYSTIVEKTIIKNARPEISCSVDSSITLNPIITVTRKNITGRGNPTYTYKLVYGGTTKIIESNSSSNKCIINDIGEVVEGGLPDSYNITVSCYDGIDWSEEVSSTEVKVVKLVIADNTGSGKCGKRPEIKFEPSGYNYIRVNGVISKINNNVATLEFEDNDKNYLLPRNYPIYASVNGVNFYNIKQNTDFEQICSLQVSGMSLPGSNGIIKPYTNNGNQYSIKFIGLENSNDSLKKYFANGVFTSFVLRFREINSNSSEIIDVSIKNGSWFESTFNFNIAPKDLYESLAKLGLNQNKSHSIICSFETLNGFDDLYTFSQKFTADFRETPEIPRGNNGMHIYVGDWQPYGPQRWSHLQNGMELKLQTYNSYISSYNEINQAVIKIIGKNFSKDIDITNNLTKEFSNVSYEEPYKYSCNFPFWMIEDSLKDDTLEFKLSITTVANTLIIKTLIKDILLQVHYNPRPYFSEITFDTEKGLRFKLVPNLRAGYELGKANSAFKKGNISFEEEEVKICVQEENNKQYSTTKEEEWYKVTGFEFNQNYNNLHIAPIVSSICTAIATLDNGVNEISYANRKSTEILTYSTVYNILPTVAYRKNQLGINLQPNSVNDSQAAIVVGAYGDKNCIYFYGDNTKASLNLTTRKLDNFVVDCGSWSVITSGNITSGIPNLAPIATTGEFSDLEQEDGLVIVLSGGKI